MEIDFSGCKNNLDTSQIEQFQRLSDLNMSPINLLSIVPTEEELFERMASRIRIDLTPKLGINIRRIKA